jgi:hypothetical protein
MVAGGNGEAVLRTATSPDLRRRSGRIPALPYPPREQFYSTQSAALCKRKMGQSGPKRKIPGGLGDSVPHHSDDFFLVCWSGNKSAGIW